MTLHVVVNVNVPALDNLVSYLSAADQARVDALENRVIQLTARLGSSGADLQTAENTNKQ